MLAAPQPAPGICPIWGGTRHRTACIHGQHFSTTSKLHVDRFLASPPFRSSRTRRAVRPGGGPSGLTVESSAMRLEIYLKSATLDNFHPCAARHHCLLASRDATPRCLLPICVALDCALSPPAARQRRLAAILRLLKMRPDAVACRCTRECRAPASPAAAPPPQVTPHVWTTHGVRLPAGRRERLLVCHRFDSRCVAGTGRSCARTARAVGGSVAAERAGGRGEVLVEASTRWRIEGRAHS